MHENAPFYTWHPQGVPLHFAGARITYILEKIGGGVGSGSLSVPLRAACTSAQILSGLSGISMVLIPSGARASSTALTIAGGAPIQPDSPTPLAPSGLVGEGVSTMSVVKTGTCSAIGSA